MFNVRRYRHDTGAKANDLKSDAVVFLCLRCIASFINTEGGLRDLVRDRLKMAT
jgi:hypothetical protein